jgi:predicted XRE-type DNA-binding protein
MPRDKEFEKVLQEAEDPKNIGKGSWTLPRNATSLQKAKYEICKQILIYKQDKKLSTKEVAEKINLTNSETKDILFYHIDYFTLDRLITYAERLLAPNEVKVVVESKKNTSHARTV